MEEQHRKALDALDRELQQITPANDAMKARIEALQHEIKSASTAPDTTPEKISGLRASLEDSVDDFAAHHPNLSEAIRIAVDSLANAGA